MSERRYVSPDTPVLVELPGSGQLFSLPHDMACELHYALGQTLARMMRKRNADAPDPDQPTGGTPVAMRLAA